MNKTDFLLDMLNYYSVAPNDRRNGIAGQSCKYAPIKETSEGCAIGRHLIGTVEEKKSWDNLADSSFANIRKMIADGECKDLQPEWMKLLPSEFLNTCQGFHDRRYNWDENGLNYEGQTNLLNIIKLYGLDEDSFSQYLHREKTIIL